MSIKNIHLIRRKQLLEICYKPGCTMVLLLVGAILIGCASPPSSQQRLPNCDFSDLELSRYERQKIKKFRADMQQIHWTLDHYEESLTKGIGGEIPVSELSARQRNVELTKLKGNLALYEDRMAQLKRGKCVSWSSMGDIEKLIISRNATIESAESALARLEEIRKARESRLTRRLAFYDLVEPAAFPGRNLEIQIIDFDGRELKLRARNTHTEHITEINLTGRASRENRLGGIDHFTVCSVRAKDQFGNTYRISECSGGGEIFPGDTRTLRVEVPQLVENAILLIELPLGFNGVEIEVPVWKEPIS